MPELPEVESYRMVIEDHCLGKTISGIDVPVPSLLKGTTVNGIKKHFEGTKLASTLRHGKYLFVRSSQGKWLFFHFGLTGDLTFSSGEPPRFSAIIFHFKKGMLCYADMRKFGRFGLVEDPLEFLKEKKWGPDALSISWNDFKERVSKKAVSIKTVLMDQKIIAGIGNEYSDEILFRTRIHPEKKASTITSEKLSEIHKTIHSVLKGAIKAEAERSRMKKYHFVVNRKPGNDCPRCGRPVRSSTVGGRTAYYCPFCQKR